MHIKLDFTSENRSIITLHSKTKDNLFSTAYNLWTNKLNYQSDILFHSYFFIFFCCCIRKRILKNKKNIEVIFILENQKKKSM